MEEELIQYIIADTTITALIGTRPARAFWVAAPQNVAKPYAVLTTISGVNDYHMVSGSGLVASRVQVDCYGLTYASAKDVSRKIETRLSGYSGTRDAIKFSGVFLDATRDSYEDDDSPDKLFRTSLDFIIWHKPSS